MHASFVVMAAAEALGDWERVLELCRGTLRLPRPNLT